MNKFLEKKKKLYKREKNLKNETRIRKIFEHKNIRDIIN